MSASQITSVCGRTPSSNSGRLDGRISSGPVQVSNGTSWSAVSRDSLNVKYNRGSGRWPFATAREGIRYSIDTTNFDDWGSSLDTSAVRGAIQDAFDAWDRVTDADLSFVFEGYSTHGRNFTDRNNTIAWESLDPDQTDNMPGP